MQQIAPYHQDHNQQQKWQTYQPTDQNLTVFKAFGNQIKNLLIFTIALCVMYLVITLFSPFTLVIIAVLVVASFMLVKINLKQIKKQGISLVYSIGLINRLSPKLKQLLFEKSIFDVYSDLLYFPLVTKIIGAFVKPLLVKPHPQQLHQTFENLPDKVQLAIARKGLLSLAPSNIQQLFVSAQTSQPIPYSFGVQTWQWKNYKLYENHHEKVHQQTIFKRIVERVDEKVSWKGFMGMSGIVMFGVYKNPSRFKRILVQNGIFVGMVFLLVVIGIKLKKRVDEKRKQQQERQGESIRINLLEKDE